MNPSFKILFTIILMCPLICSLRAQNNFGIKVNGNLSNRWSLINEQFDYYRPGYGLGIYYCHLFSDPKFGLSIDADYSYFRFNQKITGYTSYFHTKKSVALFQFPVELNYFFNKLSFSGGLKFVFGHGTGGYHIMNIMIEPLLNRFMTIYGNIQNLILVLQQE